MSIYAEQLYKFVKKITFANCLKSMKDSEVNTLIKKTKRNPKEGAHYLLKFQEGV